MCCKKICIFKLNFFFHGWKFVTPPLPPPFILDPVLKFTQLTGHSSSCIMLLYYLYQPQTRTCVLYSAIKMADLAWLICIEIVPVLVHCSQLLCCRRLNALLNDGLLLGQSAIQYQLSFISQVQAKLTEPIIEQ